MGVLVGGGWSSADVWSRVVASMGAQATVTMTIGLAVSFSSKAEPLAEALDCFTSETHFEHCCCRGGQGCFDARYTRTACCSHLTCPGKPAPSATVAEQIAQPALSGEEQCWGPTQLYSKSHCCDSTFAPPNSRCFERYEDYAACCTTRRLVASF